ncbi:hypothetical protein [Demequina lignilytica]|uniref:Nucleotidyltransferase domain-containing protein n=1 Tax=Demequina lignilytica TaxID=3051663 RepID=A0AB35MK28_9MICO|nr:hypothetical protein [Demequina sp. SYSU T0a273]MDN4484181.1 hypothetical protein [Demequina sp. SYSU T0a273]
MATTKPELARQLLMHLEQLEVRYALLHGSEQLLGNAPMSDVDVVVDRDPIKIVRELARQQGELTPFLAWEYDTGALTTFWVTSDLADGVQLDLICDPHGRGKYGLRTLAALDHIDHSVWPPQLDAMSRNAYLACKRLVKGDAKRMRDAMEASIMLPGGEALSRELLARHQVALAFARAGRLPTRLYARLCAVRARLTPRMLRRLRDRPGHVFSVSDPAVGLRAYRALSEYMLEVVARERPRLATRVADQLRTVRPIVYIHIGSKSSAANAIEDLGRLASDDVLRSEKRV